MFKFLKNVTKIKWNNLNFTDEKKTNSIDLCVLQFPNRSYHDHTILESIHFINLEKKLTFPLISA